MSVTEDTTGCPFCTVRACIVSGSETILRFRSGFAKTLAHLIWADGESAWGWFVMHGSLLARLLAWWRVPGRRPAGPAAPDPEPRAPQSAGDRGVSPAEMTMIDVRAPLARPYTERRGTHRRPQ